MIAVTEFRGKDQATRLDAPIRGFTAQVVLRAHVSTDEPKDTPWDLLQQSHPHIKHEWVDFVMAVERTENESRLRKTGFRTCWDLSWFFSSIIVNLKSVRKIDHLLRIPPLRFSGDHEIICNDVIDVLGTHCSGKTQVTDLNRCRSMRKYLRSAVQGESHQIHRDIHVQFKHEFRDGAITLVERFNKYPEGCPDPLAHLVAVPGGKRNRNGFKLPPIVRFEQPRHEIRERVLAKIRRKVSDADLLMGAALPRPHRCRGCGIPVGYIGPRALLLVPCRIRGRKQNKW